MRRKTLTADCNTCPLCKVSDEGVFLCNWGKEEKYMVPAKRSKPLFCRLKRKKKGMIYAIH